MPNADNWQSDVLRDLRGAAQQGSHTSGTPGTPGITGTPGTPRRTRACPCPPAPRRRIAERPRIQGIRAGTPTSRPVHSGRQAVPQHPGSRPVVDEALAGAVRKPRHGEPFASRAVRAVRRIVSSSAAREVAEITRTAELLQQPVTTGRQIAVTSIRGGAGKSTVAALLGTTYAHYRQDPSSSSRPTRRSARCRCGSVPRHCAGPPAMSRISSNRICHCWMSPAIWSSSPTTPGCCPAVRAGSARCWTPGRTSGSWSPAPLLRCDGRRLRDAAGRSRPVALSASQARVLTAPATLEGVTSTCNVLEWMNGLPRHVIEGTVAVLTEQVPRAGIDLDKAAQRLKDTGASVQILPYDRHLAAGGAIRTDLLAHSTRLAATRLAAEVFQLSQKRR
ncbi:MinD/ParA family protein [Streptomyces sp. M10(2022)]